MPSMAKANGNEFRHSLEMPISVHCFNKKLTISA